MTPKIEVTENPNYRTINVTGIFGSQHSMNFEILLYSDEWTAKEALSTSVSAPERSILKRTIETRLLISPFTTKLIAHWLNQNIAEYERIYGRIPSPEEVQSKLRRPTDST
jgi:hypothetical protein